MTLRRRLTKRIGLNEFGGLTGFKQRQYASYSDSKKFCILPHVEFRCFVLLLPYIVHQTTKTFFVIIDECVLDEVKLVFLRVIYMNVNIQTVNNEIKRNQQKKELTEQDRTHACTRKHTLTRTGTEGTEINLRICGDI
jgi:hypothetical protein